MRMGIYTASALLLAVIALWIAHYSGFNSWLGEGVCGLSPGIRGREDVMMKYTMCISDVEGARYIAIGIICGVLAAQIERRLRR